MPNIVIEKDVAFMIATCKCDLINGTLKEFGLFQFGVLNSNTGCCLGAGFRVLAN